MRTMFTLSSVVVVVLLCAACGDDDGATRMLPDGSTTSDGGRTSRNGRVEELCAPGITRSDAALGALGDNGGPTRTLLPAAGSPAIGIGIGCRPIDQRGRPRAASGCTAGAVEVA